jgi:hypothetical protein
MPCYSKKLCEVTKTSNPSDRSLNNAPDVRDLVVSNNPRGHSQTLSSDNDYRLRGNVYPAGRSAVTKAPFQAVVLLNWE